MADNKEIGARLKEAREKAGFATASDAANALDMKYPTYAGHENGSRGVVRALEKYARRYRVSLDWLLSGKGDGPKHKLAVPEPAKDPISALRQQVIQAAKEATKRNVPPGVLSEWMMEGVRDAFSDILQQQALEGQPRVDSRSDIYRVIVGAESKGPDPSTASTGTSPETPTFREEIEKKNRNS